MSENDMRKARIEKIVAGYNSGKPFLFCGMVFRHSEIQQILIFGSEKKIEKLLLPNGKLCIDTSPRELLKFLNEGKIAGAYGALEEFDIIPPEGIVEGESRRKAERTNEVFIIHGRDDKQALLLQKHLDKKLGIDAKMFEDFKEETGSNTIIEVLEYIRKNAGYAFIVTTAEDLGVLRCVFEESKNEMFRGIKEIEVTKACSLLESLKTRARQNVVFEFGLFMGALGRDNVCCLLQEGTQERPSDIDGILYTAFTKSVEEKYGEIDAKLEKAGFVKPKTQKT